MKVASDEQGLCTANRTGAGWHPALAPQEPQGCHLCCRLDDEAEALRYHQESHRVYPVDMEVISWLGAFHVKNEVRSHRHMWQGSWPAACLAPSPLTGCIGMAAQQDERAASIHNVQKLGVSFRRPACANVPWPCGVLRGQCPDNFVAAVQLRACSELQVYEGAVPYFSLAARVQPHEVKWQLMVASCYRRIGNYQQVSIANHYDLYGDQHLQPTAADKRLLRLSGNGGHSFLGQSWCQMLATTQKLSCRSYADTCSSSIPQCCRSCLWAGRH